MVPSLSKTLNGVADLRVHAAAAGGSWREVAMKAQGRVALSIRQGDIQASKAKMLSGAVIQGVLTALANKSARVELSCAIADLEIGQGRVRGDRMLIVTDAGTAVAEGGIDLATETIDLTIYGRPAHLRLFSVKATVSINGPMLRPAAKIHLGGGSRPDREAPEVPKVSGDRAAACDRLIRASSRPVMITPRAAEPVAASDRPPATAAGGAR
jgi:uncharacterized protein involved in outer membrane biogenesis